MSWAGAQQLAALAEFARRPARIEVVGQDVEAVRAGYAPLGRWVREFADDEVAARLRVSRANAGRRIALACDLQRFPLTRRSLEAGRIDTTRARVVTDETAALDPATARELEPALVARAEQMNASALRAPVRRAVINADPVAAQQRTARARADRRVVITPAVDGMCDLWAHLPAADAIAISTAIGAAARASKASGAPHDKRTMDQRRADFLAAPFLDALATGAGSGAGAASDEHGAVRLSRRRGQAVELRVTVSATTLLGLDDAPAELHGYGPITAESARELAPDARWRRILTDPRSGAVLEVGASTYRPSAAVQRHVEIRSPRCTFPGCRWPAEVCDLDHTVPFPAGATAPENLGPRCRRHHRFKQSTGVAITQDVDGTTHWQFPTGHQYDVAPPAIGPIHDPPPDSPPPPPPPPP